MITCVNSLAMRQHSPLAACLYDIQHCLYQWSLMIFAFISGWKEFFDCFPLFVCQITFVICCLIFFFHISYYTTFLLWTQAPNTKDPWACDYSLYKERHLVECFFQKLKWFRRIATRYDTLDSSFLSFVYLASIMILLKWYNYLDFSNKV